MQRNLADLGAQLEEPCCVQCVPCCAVPLTWLQERVEQSLADLGAQLEEKRKDLEAHKEAQATAQDTMNRCVCVQGLTWTGVFSGA